jgi:formamidopyrimidine-DNA glycosylase
VPEGLEVELYRRAAVPTVGRRVAGVDVDERQTAADLPAALRGRRIESVERVGKLLLLRTDGPTLGVRFGMTGRLVVDDVAPIERLEYGSGRDDPAWDRLVVTFRGGGTMRVNDPRRWARFDLDPDASALGPDLLSLTVDDVAAALTGRRAALKAVLLDQRSIAGLGNMCVDEVLWHAGLAPDRPADTLDDRDVHALHTAMRSELPAMLARGGSHTGVISPPVRAALPPCPADGAPLRRSVVGGRTSVWCTSHQR